MLEFKTCKASFNKENENHVKSSPSFKITAKNVTSLKLKPSSSTKISLKFKKSLYVRGAYPKKQPKVCSTVKKPLIAANQVNSDNVPHANLCNNALDEDGISINLKKKKKLLKTSLLSIGYYRKNNGTKSNSTPHNSGSLASPVTLKIPKQFKLNKLDLRLKSPFEKEPLSGKKENGFSKTTDDEKRHCSNSNKSFNFLEDSHNRFLCSKNSITKADKEAFDLFSFSPKYNRPNGNCNQFNMPTSSHSASVNEDFTFSKSSALLKVNFPHGCMKSKSVNGATSTDVNNKSICRDILILQQGMDPLQSKNLQKDFMDCFENSQFSSPILGDVVPSEQRNSAVTSPVLNSMMNKTPTCPTELSQVLSTNNDYYDYHNNCKEKNTHIEIKNTKVVAHKSDDCRRNLLLGESGSPVMQSCQEKKDSLKQRLKNMTCKPLQKLNSAMEDFSPSPILDENQFAKYSGKVKHASMGNNSLEPTFIRNGDSPILHPIQNNKSSKFCGYGHNQTKRKMNLFVGENKSDKNYSVKLKDNRKRAMVKNQESRVTSLSSKPFYSINSYGLKLESNEEINEPLSQVLSSNHIYSRSDDCKNNVELGLGNVENPEFVAFKDTFCPSSTTKITNIGASSIDKHILDITCLKSPEKYNIFSSHDYITETCSPVLDSGKHNSRCQERMSKVCTSLKTKEIQSGVGLNQKSEDLKIQHTETRKILINSPPFTPSLGCSFALHSVGSSAEPYDKCYKDTAGLVNMKSAEYKNIVSTNLKRPLSPVIGSTSKDRCKRKKSTNQGGSHLGPMLSLFFKSPGSDNLLCPNTPNLDQDETFISSPSFNSALDIRKFPLMLPELRDNFSPKENSKELKSDNICNKSENPLNCLGDSVKERYSEELYLKDSHQEKVIPSVRDKTKDLIARNDQTAKTISNPGNIGTNSKEAGSSSPILEVRDNFSPKENSKELKSDNICNKSENPLNCLGDSVKERYSEELYLKDSHQEKVIPSVRDKTKDLIARNDRTAKTISNPGNIGTNSKEAGSSSPILEGGTCKNSYILLNTNSCTGNQNDLKESSTHPKNIVTDCNSNSSSCSDINKSGRRHVRKNLSLYYEEVKSKRYENNSNPTKTICYKDSNKKQLNYTIDKKIEDSYRHRNQLLRHPTIDKKFEESKLINVEEEEMTCKIQMSGVGNLQPILSTDSEKLLTKRTFYENQSDYSEVKSGFTSYRVVKSSSKSVEKGKICENINTESLQQSGWKTQSQLFRDDDEICIEDFDESPLKLNINKNVKVQKINSFKRKLVDNVSNTMSINQLIPEAKNMLLNFEPDNQENTCDHLSSDESQCEINIQEDLTQRTSERSPAFMIEYSTTPTTKSSEETSHEINLNPPSFPPALDIEVNTSPSAAVLDSASKTRRTRIKKGSLVERLRRLVRGQRAEVNMFHHEASAQTRAETRACSLCVTSATQMCSLLVLKCRYSDAQRTMSQECGSCEEVVDPEVHVYIDPSYTKNITAGCIVTVFPPWRSEWQESRGVVVMYCVTKLRLETQLHRRDQSVPRGWTSHTTLAQFSCQSQDEACSCRSRLVTQLFTAPQASHSVQPHSGADGAITAALAGGWYPHSVKLKLTVLHCYQARDHQNQAQTRVLCVDSCSLLCQLNLHFEQDLLKLGSWKEAELKTFVMRKLTVCRRIFIDRCKGMRSFLSYLHPESSSQQILYVATPSTDWSAQLIEKSADPPSSADKPTSITCRLQELLSLPINEDVEGRARLQVRVMAVRRDELFAWEPRLDLYIKLNITSSATIPNFAARACLDLLYVWAHQGELTIDKFTKISIVESDDEDYPSVPPLAVDSSEGDLVLLDSVVTKVSSEAYLRWEGTCGHKVLRVQKTGLYFCATCRQTSASSTQKVVLEVCVYVMDIPYLIRVKVKSETARVLLADTSGQISSEKSYNVISVIGSTLKCLAIVSEVLRNSFGDIIEFVLEEL